MDVAPVKPVPRAADSHQAARAETVETPVDSRSATEDTPSALRSATLAAVERLVDDLPGTTEPMALLALARHRFGDHAAAAECWRRCLELDAGFADAWHGLGSIALEQGKDEEAASHLRKAVEVRPEMPEVRIALADALMNMGNMEEVIAVLEEDIQRFPREARSFFRLGQAHAQLGNNTQARQYLETAVRLAPETAYPYYALASVCLKLGDQEKAAHYRQEFARRKQTDRQVEHKRLKTFDDAQEVRRSATFFHLAAGNLYLRHRRPERAEPYWQKAAALDPHNQESRLQLAENYQLTNRPGKALEMFKELQAIEPDNAGYWVGAGQVQLQLGRHQDAEKSLREAVRIAPERGLAYAALAQFSLRTGRPPAEARALAQTAVDKEPTAGNYALLAVTCQQQNDLQAAREALRRAVALEPQNAMLLGALQRLEEGTK
ncbi:MAG: tetratricopeptide repeat protein [Planctomycetaceae bacterium]|nr:tetratricopeptide repeat protein [Planctomycetaceae bacterium]